MTFLWWYLQLFCGGQKVLHCAKCCFSQSTIVNTGFLSKLNWFQQISSSHMFESIHIIQALSSRIVFCPNSVSGLTMTKEIRQLCHGLTFFQMAVFGITDLKKQQRKCHAIVKRYHQCVDKNVGKSLKFVWQIP